MIRTVVTGVGGRMGSSLVRHVHESGDMKLVGATERKGSELVGLDAGVASRLGANLSIVVEEDLAKAVSQGADVVIDFSSPEAAVANSKICAEHGIALVIGTTGLDSESKKSILDAGKKIPLIVAPNTSVGVNVMFALVAQAARTMGDAYDVEIVETHHRHKKDAPSGTALRLGEEIANALGRDAATDLRLARSGIVGERTKKEIGIQAVRGGDVVGEHTVFFFGNGERLEITHRATSRDQLVLGALRAARFLSGKAPGSYEMSTVLGL